MISRINFVYVPDVGPIVTRLIATGGAWEHAWHFAGSGVITQRDFVEKIFAAGGRKPKFIVTGKTMLRIMGLFNPLLKEMVEMHYLFTDPILLDDSRLENLLVGLRRTSL